MKQIFLHTLLFIGCLNAPLQAQNAVINEFESDPSMFDGQGGEFIELYCPVGGGACNIGCWTVTDGQGLITIPSGTVIAEGAFYLIAHAPSFSCDSCDFPGIPVDLDMATCGCLNGGSYGTGIDGSRAMILGAGYNQGELLYLYDNNHVPRELWKFDNASATTFPTGGVITGAAVGACPLAAIDITNPNNSFVTNVGGITSGCNTSYTRTTDGGNTWTTDNHPTPRATNANRGQNAFTFQYSIDGGAFIDIPFSGTSNVQTFAQTLCTGTSVQFRVIIENFQNVTLGQFDAAGLIGSYFQSTQTGRVDWATVSGVGAANGEFLTLTSSTVSIPSGTSSYVLQWADYKVGLGSNSATSSNECYERMSVTFTKHQPVVSAQIFCSDATSGLNQVVTTPTPLANATYALYDDAGTQTNLVASNTSGFFSLTTTQAPTVGYYVVVTTPCNTVTASIGSFAFCRANPPCPKFDTSSIEKNNVASTPPVSACPGDVIKLFANGKNLPGGGKIQWFVNESAGFNPYAGQGSFVGEVTIPAQPICTSATTRLNEVMYRPSANNGVSPAGEYIELIGTPGANLGCTVLTDGDFTITIPPGAVVPPDGIYTIGNGTVPAYSSTLFDLNVATCACTNVAGGQTLLNLTDATGGTNGEYIALFNSAGTFQQGVIWGSPVANNTPPFGGLNLSGTGIMATVGLSGCPASVTVPAPASFATVVTPAAVNASLAVSPDGSTTWTTQAGGSLNRCNDAITVAMPSLTTTLTTTQCNKTLFFKGIVNPHPNTAGCLNTDPQASTPELQVNLVCPTANMTGTDAAICNTAAPLALNINTSGIANGTAVTINFTKNGTTQTQSATVTSGSIVLNAASTGLYTLTSIAAAGVCTAPGTGSADITVVPTPNSPVAPNSTQVCQGQVATLSASGGSNYEWALVSNFSTISGTGESFTTTAPATVFVRASNQDASGSVSCPSAAKSLTVTEVVCPAVTYPLTWLEFRALRQNSDVQLVWETGSEINTSHFVVQHSLNAINFVALGNVPAMGNSTNVHHYQYLHEHPNKGWNYYQLKEVDLDGQSTNSAIAAVFFDDNHPYFMVYPNPVKDNVQVRFFDAILPYTELMVYNSLGQLILSKNLESQQYEYQISTSDWGAGVYYIHIKNNRNTYIHKLIKE